MDPLDAISILLTELSNRANELPGTDYDPAIKGYLMEDIHRLRGRLMQGANSHGWQRAEGSVDIKVS